MGNAGIVASGRKQVAYDTLVIAHGPLSYYRLGEASRVAAVDQMGRANGTYTATGVTYGVAGLVHTMNTGVTLDGAAGDMAASDTGLPTGAAARTLEAWIKTSDSTHANADIVAYGTQVNTQDFSMRNASGVLKLLVRPTVYTLGGSLADNVPHHIVITFDGVNAQGYVDAVAVGSPQAVTPATVLAGATGLQIGVWSNFFTGTIDDVAIYGYAMTLARIAEHYQAAGY